MTTPTPDGPGRTGLDRVTLGTAPDSWGVKAREAGLGVVSITHDPHHAYMVGDRFVVLKLGD